jgi:Mrp family chromosome partitioning ATPase
VENEKMTTLGDLERSDQDLLIKNRLSKIKRKILVMSGKGGVGKSTVAAYLALTLARQGANRVGLLDVDLHGPSIARLVDARGGLQMPEGGGIKPYPYSDHLGVVSMEMVMGDRDTAVIWRGPLKISAIRQFISDIEWGDLDFLVVDSPPGTGDEPLTVAQTIPDAEALIITTPQEISLADVRKSINFCRQVNMKILGLVENMSGLTCPHCGEKIDIFGAGGGEKMAKEMGIPLLVRIPMDPLMVELSDRGELDQMQKDKTTQINKAYGEMTAKIMGSDR